MSLKNFAYDHPSYTARQAYPMGAFTAGSAGVTTKYVAHANMLVYGVGASLTVVGTSTSTATFPPQPPSTATTQVQANGAILNIIRVSNTAGTATAASLTTSTYGPFVVGNLYANGSMTGNVGVSVSYPLNSLQLVGVTGTGTTTATVAPTNALSNIGGVQFNQGDQFWAVNGTDATVVASVVLDYQIQPLASVNA
jgi:hypothetical protein